MRTEVFLNLAVLGSVALFSSTLLGVRFIETELVSQRASLAQEVVRLLLKGRGSPSSLTPPGTDGVLVDIRENLQRYQSGGEISAWALYDRDLRRVADYNGGEMAPISEKALRMGFLESTLRVEVDYPPFSGLFGFAGGEDIKPLRITGSVRSGHSLSDGLVVVDFSLRDIPGRIGAKLFGYLGYMVSAALIVMGFGLFLLGKNVVRPLRCLDCSTRRVAGGDLEHQVESDGPREFTSLAESFNVMISSLRERKLERERHIRQLEAINRDLRETREELIQSEKMASIGHLAAGMAHELGNPLGVVQGYLEILGGETANEEQREIAGRALKEMERVNRLIGDLLDYASPRRKNEDIDHFDPASAAREAKEIVLYRMGREIEILDRLPDSLPDIAMPRHRLIQVFINLLMNAYDATVSQPLNPIVLEGGVGGDTIWLSVSDHGEGIPEENLSRLFDPFFTTKAPGKGRGLGLAICRRILVEAGGKIEVSSRRNEGTTFRILLGKAVQVADAI